MLRKILPLLLVSFCLLGQNLFAQLTVKVSNIEDVKGSLYVALYNSSQYFLEPENAYKTAIIPVTSKLVEFTFEGLPKGEYALTLFHDKDDSGELNTFFGIPQEPYGFSNNAKGSMLGPPKFEAAKFQFTSKNEEINISLTSLL